MPLSLKSSGLSTGAIKVWVIIFLLTWGLIDTEGSVGGEQGTLHQRGVILTFCQSCRHKHRLELIPHQLRPRRPIRTVSFVRTGWATWGDVEAIEEPDLLIQLLTVQRVWNRGDRVSVQLHTRRTDVCLSALILPSQPANSRNVTRLSWSWSSSVKARLATVSMCWFESPGHGTSSPYRLLNWGRSSRYCRSR